MSNRRTNENYRDSARVPANQAAPFSRKWENAKEYVLPIGKMASSAAVP
jgi:hypothetical protein